MGKVNKILDFTLLAAGASFEVSIFDNVDLYRIIGGGGAALLASNTFVLKAGEVATEGATMSFRYEANVVPGGGNNVVILGQTLSAVQSKKNSDITALYRGGAWEINVVADLAQDAWLEVTAFAPTVYAVAADITTGTDQSKVVTSKAVLDWWTAAKLLVAQTFAQIITFTLSPVVTAFTGNKFLRSSAGKGIVETDLIEVVSTVVSFEAVEQGNNGIVIPYAFEIQSARTVVKEAVAATDDGTVQLKINGANVTNGLITVAASAAVDDIDTCTPTALNTGLANDILTCVGVKTTGGGKVEIQVVLKRVLS